MNIPVPNMAVIRPIRTLPRLPERQRQYLLKQMKTYLRNCEYEEIRLRCFRESVNRP